MRHADSMRRRSVAPVVPLLLLLAVAASGAEGRAAKAGERIPDFAAFAIPAGWTAKEATANGDPLLRLERDLHAITVRLAGGPASRYRTPADFMAGFETRSLGGVPAEAAGTVEVSGASRPLYRRTVPVSLPPPDEGGPTTSTVERFCLVPAGARFVVLGDSYGDSIPDPGYDGEKAWLEFLATFRLRPR